MANISGWLFVLDKLAASELITFDLQVVISYLPLSHMFEQVAHWANLTLGASIGYFSGSIPHLLDDINALRPTAFPVVPRLLNRFYDAIQSKVRNGGLLKRLVYNLAYSKKLALLKKGITRGTASGTNWCSTKFRQRSAVESIQWSPVQHLFQLKFSRHVASQWVSRL
ncbi:hypothetical protein OSTOST_14932 [Ostertagia ostertagi]